MVEILDEVGLMSHQNITSVALHQLQRCAGVKVRLHDHSATGNDGGQHHFDGAADMEKRLGAEETVRFGELEHLAAVVRTPQHGDVIKHCTFGHGGGAGGELDHRDVFGRYFARRLIQCCFGNARAEVL